MWPSPLDAAVVDAVKENLHKQTPFLSSFPGIANPSLLHPPPLRCFQSCRLTGQRTIPRGPLGKEYGSNSSVPERSRRCTASCCTSSLRSGQGGWGTARPRVQLSLPVASDSRRGISAMLPDVLLPRTALLHPSATLDAARRCEVRGARVLLSGRSRGSRRSTRTKAKCESGTLMARSEQSLAGVNM